LAAGDVAEVYACRDEEKLVAVKLFRPTRLAFTRIPTLSPNAALDRLRQRFRDEAELMAGFEHPNIVPVLEIGALDPNTLYYAMPYFPTSLASEVWQSTSNRDPSAPLPRNPAKALTPDLALRRLRDILIGLSVVHEKGFVHRDLKPKNILVDANGVAAIADFGVAKVPWPGYTPLRPDFGTPPFVSPEQSLRSVAADARSDVYAVGAIAYFILTGVLPSTNLSAKPLDRLVGTKLSAWIMQSLHSEPNERVPDATVLLDQLNEITANPERPD
jgi:serine/threonine protein kinase